MCYIKWPTTRDQSLEPIKTSSLEQHLERPHLPGDNKPSIDSVPAEKKIRGQKNPHLHVEQPHHSKPIRHDLRHVR